jgi:hypothetical protein
MVINLKFIIKLKEQKQLKFWFFKKKGSVSIDTGSGTSIYASLSATILTVLIAYLV